MSRVRICEARITFLENYLIEVTTQFQIQQFLRIFFSSFELKIWE
jgi:hypothetical protein